MAKPRGAVCNLDCHYCFYLKKQALYPGSASRMSPEVLETFIRDYIAAQPIPEVTFAWQGGEPTLMGLDFFRDVVRLQQQHSLGKTIHNALQTNGLLLDRDWCHFLRENQFLVGLSLDGPRHLHDAYRQDKGGQPTHARVLAAAGLLRAYGVEYNILCCINDRTAAQPLEVYRFLRERSGTAFIQFIPIVELEGSQPSTRSVSGAAFGEFLCTIFDEWVRRDVGRVFVQAFDTALAAWSDNPIPLCVQAPECGNALALEHNGDLYACDHFVDPAYLLGNITAIPVTDLVSSPQQVQFGRSKRTSLPRQCQECKVLFACNGGCPKDRSATTASGEAGLNVLCEGYLRFFTHIDGPMRRMTELLANRQPPALIMAEMPARSRRRHSR